MNLIDEVRALFKMQIDKMFFCKNEILSVSETAMNISDPEDTTLTVTVKGEDGIIRKWMIKEIKEN